MITLSLNDGVRRDVLESITHGRKEQQSIDLYNSPLWSLKCEELVKLKVAMKPRDSDIQPALEEPEKTNGPVEMTRPLAERPWSWRALGIERENKRQLRRQERLAKGYPNAIAKARLYEAALAEPGATYGTVARRFGVTREEICQYMVVLKRLPPEMIAAIEHERSPSTAAVLLSTATLGSCAERIAPQGCSTFDSGAALADLVALCSRQTS